MPVVGITPNIYGFNNLNQTLSPYVNEVQFYNPWTGALGPNYKPSNILDSITEGFKNNPNYTVLDQNQNVKSSVYNNNNINVGLYGSDADILKVRQILDKHFSSGASASVVTPVATSTIIPSAKSDIEFKVGDTLSKEQLDKLVAQGVNIKTK